MDFLQEFKSANFNIASPISITELVINLTVGILLSFVIRQHYIRYGSTLTNRNELSRVFPLILLTTVLVISIVKSSLSLSLGLVGALSIVRFRTPIKEPEELAYLFICIAAGLGLGANQTLPTVIGVIIILLVMIFSKKNLQKKNEKNMFITIEYVQKDKKENLIIKNINEILAKHLGSFDLRRADYSDTNVSITYLVNIGSIQNLENIFMLIRKQYPSVSINYIDQNQIPSI
jgi:hypothetical protein